VAGREGHALWGWLDTMIQEAQEEEQRATCVHGVNQFTNHGHVNLLVLAVGDPEQAMRLVKEMLEQRIPGDPK